MKNTLLILGAGASKAIHHCFPTGFELLQSIHSHLFNDKNDVIPNPGEGEYVSDLTNKVVSIIRGGGIDHEKKLKAYKKKLYNYVSGHEVGYLRGSLTTSISIDDFTNSHDSCLFRTISQYATAHILKGSEHAYCESNNKTTEHWLHVFLENLTKDPGNIENISTRLHVVSFNYDRLFAYLFKEYIKSNYQEFSCHLDDFENKCIYFPYGSLGSLKEIPFKSPNDKMDEMIRAYPQFQLLERRPKTWDTNDNFDVIGFIGFGFDETNFNNLNLTQFADSKVLSSYYNKPELDHQKKVLQTVFNEDNITYYESANDLAGKILT